MRLSQAVWTNKTLSRRDAALSQAAGHLEANVAGGGGGETTPILLVTKQN